ncbi:MAG: sugar transferase [Actinomycetota bacterium]
MTDAVVALLALFLATLVDGTAPQAGAFLVPPLLVVLAKAVGLYDRDENLLHKSTLDEAPSLFMVATLFALTTWLADGLVTEAPLGRPAVLVLYGGSFLFALLARGSARRLVRNASPTERCLVIGDAETARALKRKLTLSFSTKAVVVGRIALGDNPEDEAALSDDGAGAMARVTPPTLVGSVEMIGLTVVEHDVHRVVIAPVHAEVDETLEIIKTIRALGIKVSLIPRMFEVVGSAVEFDDVDGVTLLGVRDSRLTRSSRLLKRGMDLVGSIIGLTLLSPVLALIALAVKLDAPGPILFRQTRIGRNGREFSMVKFRSMVRDADAMKAELLALNETEGLFKISSDPRVTRVGSLLRRTSLDELPQLWNVLRGEMSLVGPRPLVLDDDSRIFVGWKRHRMNLVPGMTGAWQIVGSTRVPLEEMVKMDYLYGANWSLWSDIKILLRTVLFVVGRQSA